jgi:hypothetical protein
MAAEALAADRFLEALEGVKPGKTRKFIRSDIRTSMTLNQTTLDEFVGTFGAQISDVLELLREKEAENAPDPASSRNKGASFRDDRARICLNLLNASTWPSKVDPALCVGLSLQPLPPRGPVSETITAELIAARPEKRMCRYRDVLRATDIFETRKSERRR